MKYFDAKINEDNFFDEIKNFIVRTEPSESLAEEFYREVCNHLRNRIEVSTRERIRDSLLKESLHLSNEFVSSLRKIGATSQPGSFYSVNFALPNGTKFIANRNDVMAIVVEQRPSVRTISHSPVHFSTINYRLSFPYVIFCLFFKKAKEDIIDNNTSVDRYTFLKLRCAFNNKPLKSLNDIVFKPILPNISLIGEVCLGALSQIRGSKNCKETDLPALVERVLAFFWQSNFTHEIPENLNEYGRKGFNFVKWSEGTIQDNEFYKGIPLIQFKHLSSNIDNNLHLLIEHGFDKHCSRSEAEIAVTEIMDSTIRRYSSGMTRHLNEMILSLPITKNNMGRSIDSVLHKENKKFIKFVLDKLEKFRKKSSNVGGQVLGDNAESDDSWQLLKMRYRRLS